ncbi:hypothetical protein DWZ38_03540 [Ruminococcus sp. AF31-8BH]|nr:hypothetical protein DWZ38_03540 [Ruminococcus sp. AF31-8BH]
MTNNQHNFQVNSIDRLRRKTHRRQNLMQINLLDRSLFLRYILFFQSLSHYRVYWRSKKKITKHYQT